MKKPDPWKHEAWLRRILDADKFESVVYFEEAVLADSATLQAKGQGRGKERDGKRTAAEERDARMQSESTALAACLFSLLPKGYHLFLVTNTSFHYLQTSKDTSLSSTLTAEAAWSEMWQRMCRV